MSIETFMMADMGVEGELMSLRKETYLLKASSLVQKTDDHRHVALYV